MATTESNGAVKRGVTEGFGGAAESTGGWFATCEAPGHPTWTGPNRSDREAAAGDADSHNNSCDASGAHVVAS
jgi:hypothetical protein